MVDLVHFEPLHKNRKGKGAHDEFHQNNRSENSFLHDNFNTTFVFIKYRICHVEMLIII